MDYQQKAKLFLSEASEFMLGDLVTESFHPKTIGLAETAKLNINEAIKQFVSVDEEMLKALCHSSENIEKLSRDIEQVLEQKDSRVLICGCGATGRLSLTLEHLWNTLYPEKKGKVRAFMAGGDAALVKSIEKFEDFPEYGMNQLKDHDFSSTDLLLAVTEGGETPWVIGACEAASELSQVAPYFIYCNPDSVLKKVKRSQNILINSKIKKLNLTHCPQALSGSTRLQASTIQMAAIGFALFKSRVPLRERLNYFKDWYLNLDHLKMKPFIEKEAKKNQLDELTHYIVEPRLAISVFTDTTERTPTFNLIPFEDNTELKEISKCYVMINNCMDSQNAWTSLLSREVKGVEWGNQTDRTSINAISNYDFSLKSLERRTKLNSKKASNFIIKLEGSVLLLDFDGEQAFFTMPSQDQFLVTHLILKMLLNMHSTIMMGRLGRFESNIMTWVKPSNNKLIDRTTRYAKMLLEQDHLRSSYDDIVFECFKILEEGLSSQDSMVLKIVEKMKKN